MSRLVVLSEQILLRLLSFSLAFCVSLIAFLPALNFQKEQKLRILNVEIAKPQLNGKCDSPNPLTLIIELDKKENIRLNGGEFGKLEDLTSFENKLTEIFKDRESYGVFNEAGTEIEKTIIIRPEKTIEFEEVVKLIDSLNKIDANVIIDPYEEYNYCMGSHCPCNRFRRNFVPS